MISARLVGIALILALLIGSGGALASAEYPGQSQDDGFVQDTPPAQDSPSLLESVESFNDMTGEEMLDLALENKLILLGVASALVFIVLWLLGGVGPGGLAKVGLRDVSPHHAPMWLFAGLLVFTAQAFALKALSQQSWVTGGEPESFRGVAAVQGGTYLLTSVVALGMIQLLARTAGGAGLKLKPGDLFFGIACFALAYPVIELTTSGAAAAHQMIADEVPLQIAHPTLETITQNFSDPWVWALIAAVVIGAPIVEETIFRVFLQTAMLRWFGSPWLAILLSAVPFTALHYLAGENAVPYYSLAPIFVLAVAMGLAYERTRRLGVPILMHMCFNGLNVFLALRLAEKINF